MEKDRILAKAINQVRTLRMILANYPGEEKEVDLIYAELEQIINRLANLKSKKG